MSTAIFQRRAASSAQGNSVKQDFSAEQWIDIHEGFTTVEVGASTLFSPYMITSPSYKPDNAPDLNASRHQTQFYDKRYYSPETTEPLSDDMLDLLRKELEAIFFEFAAEGVRYTDEFKLHWSRAYGMSMFSERELCRNYMEKEPSPGPIIKRANKEVRRPIIELLDRKAGSIIEFFNKEVAVYFETGNDHTGYEDRKLGRYITHLWYRMHGGRPPLQRHHFFGKAICFGDQHRGFDIPKQKPKTIFPHIPSFHRTLCDSLSVRLNDFARFERLGRLEFWPRPSQEIQSWREHGFTVGHLFRALFMVVDDQVLDERVLDDWVLSVHDHLDIDDWNTTKEYRRSPIELKNEDFIQYNERRDERVVRQYTVLLVRTGDDQHLSSAISFQPLLESGQALEVNRDDIGSHLEGDIVRVRLYDAIQFILDLKRKEEAAFPSLRRATQVLEEEQRMGCGQWIERVLEHAGEVGIDTNGFTWTAIRRVRARLNGEAFQREQVNSLCDRLSSWDV